nr:MAG TPA: hypothetical protein [Crassvirales sp.]
MKDNILTAIIVIIGLAIMIGLGSLINALPLWLALKLS